MNAEQNNNTGIFKKVIVILLVLNLAVSGGIIGYLVKTDRKDDKATQTVVQTTAEPKENAGETMYVLSIGTNDKDTYKQKIPTEDARQIINNICKKYVQGYSSYDANGGWTDEKGVLTQEKGFVYTFQGATRDQIKSIMDEVLKELNQNSIMVEVKNENVSYYDGKSDDWGK